MASSPGPSSTTTPGFLEGREPTLSPTPTEGDVFTLYDTSTGETFDVTAEEFLPAALACEMDLSAPDEALKAQAVALYTFYSYQRSQNTGEGADFACDSANWLVYVPVPPWKSAGGRAFPPPLKSCKASRPKCRGSCSPGKGNPSAPRSLPSPAGTPPPPRRCGARTSPISNKCPAPGTVLPRATFPQFP